MKKIFCLVGISFVIAALSACDQPFGKKPQNATQDTASNTPTQNPSESGMNPDAASNPAYASNPSSVSAADANAAQTAPPLAPSPLTAPRPKAAPIDPIISGCADGTREGFMDTAAYPFIAACDGAWSNGYLHADRPACGRSSGNDGSNAAGDGCSVEDLCAEGWHVCLGDSDVASCTEGKGCKDLQDGQKNEPVFYLTRASSHGNSVVSPESAGADGLRNDVFGCGNMGRYPGAFYLNAASGNLCDTFKQYDSCCVKNVQTGETLCSCPGYAFSSEVPFEDRPQPLSYFSLNNGHNYETVWNCGDDKSAEASHVTKRKADEQGGVLCCRNSCETNADCCQNEKDCKKICSHHVCRQYCQTDEDCANVKTLNSASPSKCYSNACTM